MITVCKIMIYFDIHIRIYIDLNETVFIIDTDVIDTVLGSVTRYISKHGNFNDVMVVYGPLVHPGCSSLA